MPRRKKNPKGRDRVSANEEGKGFAQISRVLLESPAYQSLRTVAAAKALPVFIAKWGHAEATKGQPVCNFHYSEAERLHGISRKSFARGLQELHSVGFIDVPEKGGVWNGNRWTATVYRKSERWRKFGTADFLKILWDVSEPCKRAIPQRRFHDSIPKSLPPINKTAFG